MRIVFLCLLCFACQTFAERYYYDHQQGWHWYQKRREKSQLSPLLRPGEDPKKAMHRWQQRIKTALNRAILAPTVSHVEHYLRLQQQLTRQATLFTQAWQQTLLQAPQFNYTRYYPETQLGQKVYWQNKQEKIEKALKAVAKEAGLWFFYHHRCAYCRRFAPILKDFTERSGIALIPIRLGRASLPEFPKSQYRPALARRLHVRATPALYLIYPKTGKILPVAQGLVSQSSLAEQLLRIHEQQQKKVPV